MVDGQQYPKRINASPTKEFFIYMITRDITLTRAILDLVDNSIDGIRRIQRSEDLCEYWIRLELDRNHFKIADNCGGIPVDIARNYAFRFGRPKDAPLSPGSVGQFGVGMKRTFFKLGNCFFVKSTTSSSRFDINIDIEKWIQIDKSENADAWHFEFNNVEENLSRVSRQEVGTQIEITKLHETVIESFSLENFITRLKQEISSAHTLSLEKRLNITVNGIPLNFEPLRLFYSDKLKPIYVDKTIDFLNDQPCSPVKVKLYSGVAERNLHDGGWYVYCNGRLVLQADQTSTTVWGDVHSMRQYHPDFAFFRGYAFFDSDNPSLLPWTTTKTGVDIDSPIYKNIQQNMIEATKPVLAFLSNLARETAERTKGERIDTPLADAIQNADATRTDALPTSSTFVFPLPSPVPRGPKMQRIQYIKPASEVEKAKLLLKVRSFTLVGEKTFEYYMKYEGEK